MFGNECKTYHRCSEKNREYLQMDIYSQVKFMDIMSSKKLDTLIPRNFPKLSWIFVIKRPARDACLCMGELLAPPAPAAPPAPPAPHFVFLITL